MSDLPPDPSDSPLADPMPAILRVRGPRASSVIVHRFPSDHADAFMEWLHGVTDAAGAYPGYQATEVYPPTSVTESDGDGDGDEWVVIIHFDDETMLQAWLDGPDRAAWVAKLPHAAREFRIETMPSGFGTWAAGQTADGIRVPHWKSFLLVLVGLYPVVMVLTIVVSPRTADLGTAFAMLVGNVVSVAILEWLVMPLLNRLLAPWLRARGRDGRLVSVIGAALIVAALLGMAVLFRLVNG